MSLVASQIINQGRILTATPAQNSGRWSDTNILALLDMVQQHLVQELLFPESRITQVATPDTQYYALPDAHRLYRVYLDGQICVEVPGGIDTLEGRQIGEYDASGQGVQTPGQDGPLNAGTIAQPQWVIQTPMVYPYLANYGPPAPMTQPSFVGSQPRYYRRGGGIGITPAPANAATITVDGVFAPIPLTNTAQVLQVPSYFYDALVWYLVLMMKFADDTSATQDQRNFAEKKYQEHLGLLRTTIRQYKFEDLTTLVRNDRWRYAFGRRTTGFSGRGNF